MSKIIVTGGCGYIGTYVTRELRGRGHVVVPLDMSNSSGDSRFVECDITDAKAVDSALSFFDGVDVVVHLAALAGMKDSVNRPAEYYHTNVGGTINVVSAAVRRRIPNIIFSSSWCVVGNVLSVVTEETPKSPTSPYARSKSICEDIIADITKNSDTGVICLRYANVAGGKQYTKNNRITTAAIRAAIGNTPFIVDGSNHPTEDGTIVRDFVSVYDVASATSDALDLTDKFGIYNVGTGTGTSILQVVACVEKLSGKRISVKYAPENDFDPSWSAVSSKLFSSMTGWKPRRSSIEDIVGSQLGEMLNG